MEKKMNLKLTFFGLSGVGKSTIGNLIAKYYNIPCIDIDSIIEEKYGIDKIFKEYGEKEFRTIETYYLQTLAEENCLKSHILIGGSGIIESEFNRNILKNYLSIYLEISTDLICAETLTNRPLLKLQTLEEHLKRREKYFNQADFTVHIEERTYEENIEYIKNLIDNLKIFN